MVGVPQIQVLDHCAWLPDPTIDDAAIFVLANREAEPRPLWPTLGAHRPAVGSATYDRQICHNLGPVVATKCAVPAWNHLQLVAIAAISI
jgi:hypothetical protein